MILFFLIIITIIIAIIIGVSAGVWLRLMKRHLVKWRGGSRS